MTRSSAYFYMLAWLNSSTRFEALLVLVAGGFDYSFLHVVQRNTMTKQETSTRRRKSQLEICSSPVKKTNNTFCKEQERFVEQTNHIDKSEKEWRSLFQLTPCGIMEVVGLVLIVHCLSFIAYTHPPTHSFEFNFYQNYNDL